MQLWKSTGCRCADRKWSSLTAEEDSQSIIKLQSICLYFKWAKSALLFVGKIEKRCKNTVSLPKKVAASEALKLNWDSRNLGPNVDIPAIRVASVAPAKQRKMKVGFFRSSSTDLGKINILELNYWFQAHFDFRSVPPSSKSEGSHVRWGSTPSSCNSLKGKIPKGIGKEFFQSVTQRVYMCDVIHTKGTHGFYMDDSSSNFPTFRVRLSISSFEMGQYWKDITPHHISFISRFY